MFGFISWMFFNFKFCNFWFRFLSNCHENSIQKLLEFFKSTNFIWSSKKKTRWQNILQKVICHKIQTVSKISILRHQICSLKKYKPKWLFPFENPRNKQHAINESIYFTKHKKTHTRNTERENDSKQETKAYVANVNVVFCGKTEKIERKKNCTCKSLWSLLGLSEYKKFLAWFLYLQFVFIYSTLINIKFNIPTCICGGYASDWSTGAICG